MSSQEFNTSELTASGIAKNEQEVLPTQSESSAKSLEPGNAAADMRAKQEEENRKRGGIYSVLPPELPTQEGPHGVRYDFNDGARIFLPDGNWKVQILDDESGNIIFACESKGGWVVSTKKYFIPFAIKIWRGDEEKPCVDHVMNLENKDVLIVYPIGSLGDLIGWVPYAERFQQKHNCKIELSMGQNIIDLFEAQYPTMKFSTPEKVSMKQPYATYRIGLYFRGDTTHQPIDFRKVGLHRTAGHILGVDPEEIVPRFKLGSERQIKEPYVCIATKSTTQCKHWNNGFGWPTVIKYLKSLGYRVLCIDRDETSGMGYVWNQLPHDAENFTGNIPLQKRIELIEHADFFIGLSSGLTWVAWGCKVPIVLISGFTLPLCEFNTPYRVINTHGCIGCWDDVNENFDHQDFFWCPKHKGTERQYECTRLITPKQVIGHIDRLIADLKKKKSS